MKDIGYGYEVMLPGSTLEQAVERVTAALKEQGFGVLTEIDVKSTMKKKLDVDFRPYKILGACNPNLAHQALAKEAYVGLVLPCNVVVQQMSDDAVSVSLVKPEAMFKVIDKPGFEDLVAEADRRLRAVAGALA